MKKYVLLSTLMMSALGCDRLKMEEPTKLQIKLPGTFSVANKTSSNVSSMGTRPTPTGMTGTQPINCYLVAAGGPEEAMQRNVCGRKDGTTTFTPRKIGPWIGAAPAGTSISIDVPSGIDRVIYVVGFYAATATACHDFRTGGFPPDSELSKPYIVGEVGKLTLNPGETKDLPLTVAFNANNYFDGCDGPDFPSSGGGGGTSSTPTKIEITKEWFPYSSFVENSCQSFDLVLKDDQGRHAAFSTPISVTPQVVLGGANQAIYSNWTDCQNSTNTLSAVTIPANSDRVQVVFKTLYNYTAPTASLSIASVSAPSSLTIVGNGNYPVYSSSTNGFDLQGPWSVLPDTCYPFKALLKNMSNGTGSNYSGVTANITANGVSFYSSLANCQNNSAALTQVVFSSSVFSSALWMKMSSSVTANAVPVTFTDANSTPTYIALNKNIEKGYGDSTPVGVEFRGPNQMMGIGSCPMEPHSVFLVNQYHTPLVAAAATNIALSSSGVSLFPTYNDCVGSGTTPINSVSIAANEFEGLFFIKTLNLGMASIIGSYGSFSNQYNIYVDGFHWDLTSAAPSSIANNTCVPLTAELKNSSGSVVSNTSYESLYVNIGGVTTPSTATLYTDSACAAATSPPLYVPSTGPASVTFYVKVVNGTAGNITANINVSGSTNGSSPTKTFTVSP